MAIVAHQGGWDELIIPIVAVGAFLAVYMTRAREAEDPDAPPGPCEYCGNELGEDDRRCSRCGFRTRLRAPRPRQEPA